MEDVVVLFTPRERAVLNARVEFKSGLTIGTSIEQTLSAVRRFCPESMTPIQIKATPVTLYHKASNHTADWPHGWRVDATWAGGSGKGVGLRPLDALVMALKTYFDPADTEPFVTVNSVRVYQSFETPAGKAFSIEASTLKLSVGCWPMKLVVVEDGEVTVYSYVGSDYGSSSNELRSLTYKNGEQRVVVWND